MKLWQSFRMAFQTLLAKKVRSLLTMLGTVIGVTAVIALVSVTAAQNEANRGYWMKMSKNLVNVNFYIWGNSGWNNERIAQELSYYLSEDLKDLSVGMTPSSAEWGKSLRWGGKSLQVNQMYYGSDQFSLCQQYEIESGRDLSYMDIQRRTKVVVIGSIVRDVLFNYADPIGETVYINNEPFTVVGVYRQREKPWEGVTPEDFMQWSSDNMMVVPYTLTRILNPQMQLTDYYIKAVDAKASMELVELLNEFLGTMITRDDYQKGIMGNGYYNAYTNTEYIEDMEQAEQSQAQSLMMIAAISLLVGGIGIMNIMLVTVTERTREIGVRKAIGAPRRNIITQFLIEAVVLSGLGGVLGVIFGFMVTLFWGKIQFNIIASPDLGITALAFGVSLAMGIVFGIYPAIKAASLQPVDALRNE